MSNVRNLLKDKTHNECLQLTLPAAPSSLCATQLKPALNVEINIVRESMRNTVIAGWTFTILALVMMLIGHMGKHDLSWISNHISTFAANSPNDAWITASMIMSVTALLCISVLISRYQILGTNFLVHFIPILIGAVVSGLTVLAAFEETAATIKQLKSSNFNAIRQQSFHDAGLMIFFYCSICLSILAGFFCAIFRRGRRDKILGVIIAGLGPISFFLMTTPWPKLIGINGPSAGLKQRASLLCIWISMALLQSLAFNISLKRDRESLRTL